MPGERRERPDVLPSETRRIRTGYGKVYTTISFDDNGQMFEVFVQTGDSGDYTNAWCDALGKTISNALRSGVDPEIVAQDLMGIRADRVAEDNGDKILSIPDAVGTAMMRACDVDRDGGGD